MNVVLTGFMGTGKSTVGKRLARKLGMTFVDLDSIIEKEAGIRVKDIFASEGEEGFRNMETAAIDSLVTGVYGEGLVVATGGGAVIRDINRQKLRSWGVVINLKASISEIKKRVGVEDKRPLLSADNREDAIIELLSARLGYYNDCDYEFDTSDMNVNDAVDQIAEILKNYKK